MSWGPGAIRPVTTIKFLRTSEAAKLPCKAHEDDAAYDLHSAVRRDIWPGDTMIIDTGFKVAIPSGYVGLVCSRSGLAAKEGVFVLNSPGVIDAGYRGDLLVILCNTGSRPFEVEVGDRVGQLMLQEVKDCRVMEVSDFRDGTTRGESGLGSTGK
jgi:dUTP pyrophosphatase